jgi:FAD/FMN-containing dehydrogenase
MYKVEWKDKAGVSFEEEVVDLSKAMAFAKELGILVTINGGGMEIVGLFGADSIENGVCPDGVPYTWMKRRKQ